MGDASRRLRRTSLTGARHTAALVLRPLDATFRLNAPTHPLQRTGNESDLQRAVAQKAFLFPSAEDVEETRTPPAQVADDPPSSARHGAPLPPTVPPIPDGPPPHPMPLAQPCTASALPRAAFMQQSRKKNGP
ncbi:hypothetical protein PHLGIDRAFT_115632 [Phlebiopsis gigantea 11061_1 CR5-6]|uniref:Uncharacterized protein n=1 Tax=Phlebiopsis gigantea (strain 11061_1 CR5-6) TaxID=745531 RepID=A0A0C3S3M6_PHLG1|nr:hypothetical protein PHLGIDRAFT_115632 [Phlebiopsis gigantea 11061_1 CR5-6]